MLNGQRQGLYGWGADGLTSRADSQGRSLFYLKDALGSILSIVDDHANVIQGYEFSGYGEDLSGKDSLNAFRFEGGIGGWTDNDSGLVLFWHRWYDSLDGKWINEDPTRQSGGINLYEYSFNLPTTLFDATGLKVLVGTHGVDYSLGNFHSFFVKYFTGAKSFIPENAEAIVEGQPQFPNYVVLRFITQNYGKLIGNPPTQNLGALFHPDSMVDTSYVLDDCYWDEILKFESQYNEKQLDYSPRTGPNSNSLIGSILRKMGESYKPSRSVAGWDYDIFQ